MNDIPFALPQSLASYVLQFEDNPDKTLRRLKKQLKKRGPDPVGYFLLAWFYYRNGLEEKAMETALRAKNYAPGSPFFAKLPYFFAHPSLFEAWQPTQAGVATDSASFSTFDHVIGDLNTLIKKLSNIEVSKIKHKLGDTNKHSPATTMDTTDGVEDIVSETLAKIHSMQHNYKEAIDIYQKLQQRHPEKKTTYEKEILKLKEKKENQGE